MTAEGLPVIALRLMNGRVGSTLLMQLLATSANVVFDRTYPFGEYRYLSYCVRLGSVIGREHDPTHDRVTPFFFERDGAGPIPWSPTSLDRASFGLRSIDALWAACGDSLRARNPRATWYAEKIAFDLTDLDASNIEYRTIDLVRDPRDCLASIRAFTAATGVDGLDGAANLGDDEYVERFVAATRARLEEIAGPRDDRIVMRYEDFATDLAATASHLGHWLDEPFDAAAVEARRADLAHHRTTESVAASIGRWRRDLSPLARRSSLGGTRRSPHTARLSPLNPRFWFFTTRLL